MGREFPERMAGGRRSRNAGTTIGQRWKRWPIVVPTLKKRLGLLVLYYEVCVSGHAL